MTIREYTIADLEQCLRDNSLWRGDVIPITKHRALSHIHNPRAEKTDIALLVAFDGERIVGYLGVLPDKLFVGDQVHKIGWLTAWWADPDRKYAGVGLLLLVKAMKAFGERLAASAFSDKARAAFTASKKFVTLRDVTGITALTRCDAAGLLPKKWPKLKVLVPLLQALDVVGNIFMDWRWKSWEAHCGTAAEIIPQLDDKASQFIAQHQQNDLTRRAAEELEWIARYPWVLSEREADESAHKYAFSSAAWSFAFHFVKVFDENRHMVGFLMVSVRDGHLRVPYCCYDPAHSGVVLRAIGHCVVLLQANRVTLFQDDLVKLQPSVGLPLFYSKVTLRQWIVSAASKDLPLGKLRLQDGDGDCAFT